MTRLTDSLQPPPFSGMPPSLPLTRISEKRAFLKQSGKGIVGSLTRCVKAVINFSRIADLRSKSVPRFPPYLVLRWLQAIASDVTLVEIHKLRFHHLNETGLHLQ